MSILTPIRAGGIYRLPTPSTKQQTLRWLALYQVDQRTFLVPILETDSLGVADTAFLDRPRQALALDAGCWSPVQFPAPEEELLAPAALAQVATYLQHNLTNQIADPVRQTVERSVDHQRVKDPALVQGCHWQQYPQELPARAYLETQIQNWAEPERVRIRAFCDAAADLAWNWGQRHTTERGTLRAAALLFTALERKYIPPAQQIQLPDYLDRIVRNWVTYLPMGVQPQTEAEIAAYRDSVKAAPLEVQVLKIAFLNVRAIYPFDDVSKAQSFAQTAEEILTLWGQSPVAPDFVHVRAALNDLRQKRWRVEVRNDTKVTHLPELYPTRKEADVVAKATTDTNLGSCRAVYIRSEVALTTPTLQEA